MFVANATCDNVIVVENMVVDALVQRDGGIVENANETSSTLGIECETNVVQGNPAPTIVEYTNRYGHDPVAMSAHGRRGVSRYLQGNANEKVVHLSSVPVLTARMQSDEQPVFPCENVLITTGGSAGTTRAVQHGLALAESLGAAIHVLSVVGDVSLNLDIRSIISGQEHEQATTEAIKEIIEDAETYDITDTVQYIEQGDPADVILNCIDASDIHVVVMRTTGRRGTNRILLGSVAERAVQSAPVPVFMIDGME